MPFIDWLNQNIWIILIFALVIGIILYKSRKPKQVQPSIFNLAEPSIVKKPSMELDRTIYNTLTEEKIKEFQQKITKIKQDMVKSGQEFMRLRYEMEEKIGRSIKNIQNIQEPYNQVIYGINSLSSFFSQAKIESLTGPPIEDSTKMFEPEYKIDDNTYICNKCGQGFETLEAFERTHKGIH